MKRKFRWFGHVVIAKGTRENTILQSKVEVKRLRVRLAKQWLDDVKEWTGLSLNEMWNEPEDRVARRKRISRAIPMD